MRRVIIALAVILAFSRISFSQSSGCAQFLNSNDVVCGSGGDCVFNTPGTNNQYGVGYTCYTISCCGGSVPNCSFDGVNCWWAKLDEPGTKERLLELAETQDLLVVSCEGQYRPFFDVLRSAPGKGDLLKPRPERLILGGL